MVGGGIFCGLGSTKPAAVSGVAPTPMGTGSSWARAHGSHGRSPGEQAAAAAHGEPPLSATPERMEVLRERPAVMAVLLGTNANSQEAPAEVCKLLNLIRAAIIQGASTTSHYAWLHLHVLKVISCSTLTAWVKSCYSHPGVQTSMQCFSMQ